MELEIRIDRGRCIGSGQCVHVAPRVFDQDDRALALVVDPRGEPEETIVRAVTACPMEAISLDLDGSRVTADDLRGWMGGAVADDPLVAVLAHLSDEHHELREALATSSASSSVDAAEAARTSTRAHLRAEDDVYAAIVSLVDRQVVDAFERDHRHIERALAALDEVPSDPAERAGAVAELAAAVDDHIRLEETVLFPLVLAAVARRHEAGAITTG